MSEFICAPTIDVWMYVNLSVKELFYEMPIEELIGQGRSWRWSVGGYDEEECETVNECPSDQSIP